MEKTILQWSYWVGVACIVVACIMRALNTLGVAELGTKGNPIGYRTFLDGAALLLLTALASAAYIWSKRQG